MSLGPDPTEIADIESSAGTDAKVAASLYRHHLFASRHFSDLACQLETEHVGTTDSEIIRRHRAYVIGSVLAATAFLEASINELYLEVQDHIVNDGSIGGRRVL